MPRPNSIRANVNTAARQVGAAADGFSQLVAVLTRIAVAIETRGISVEGKHIPAGVVIEAQQEHIPAGVVIEAPQECKGGQNPPNVSTTRPPAPVGSGGSVKWGI